ncbi:MAG: restriction endonuclease subunit S [Thermodesulfobacteriota bacterium]
MVEAMGIQKGFKQTEVGVIPRDWGLFPIEDLTPKNRKYNIVDGPFGSNLKTIHYRKSGIPIITSGYVTDGKFSASEYLYVDLEKFKQEKRSAVRGGDIVMAKIGERCGASAILPKDHQEGILSGNALKITIDENRFSKDLIAQILWNHHIMGNFELLRTTGAQPAISMANLKKYKIPLPPTKAEQTAIAAVLNDADTLITQLEKLIAKKRAIKQGAVQELLKPKVGWEANKLGDFLDYEQPTKYLVADTEYNDHNQTPVLTAGKSFILGYTNEGFGIFTNLPVIIFDDFTTSIKFVNFPFKVKSSAMKMLKPKNENVNLRFVFELMQMIKFDSTDHKRYWISEYQNIEVKVPESKEQTRIAQILSDMDAEIETLERKLKKYKMIKQGMMQNLLTGKIRLV